MIGAIHPPSSGRHKWIITTIKYFTKWVEAALLVDSTGKKISSFILNHIICRFGIPHVVLTYNALYFNNQLIDELCEKFFIIHHSSSIYYPQGNDQVEATNKTIINILKRTVNNIGRDYHLQLNLSLWTYKTSVRTPAGTTPFFLVYGCEAILPLEVEIPSLRVTLRDILSDEDYRVACLEKLELLEEHQCVAHEYIKVYQNRLSRYYNKKVKPRVFQVGDLVLWENPKNRAAREKKGKWEANWIGPYIIIESFGTGTYRLLDCDGTDIAEPINSIHLKRFYI